jgi:hypothetical protein
MKTSHEIGKKENIFRRFLEGPKADLTSEERARLIDDYRLDRLPHEEQSVIIRAYHRIMSESSD